MVIELSPGYGESLGHFARVTSAKWIDQNLVASGGWDKNILIWDIRTAAVATALNGPHVRGDSIDVCGDMILAGSYHHQDQIQLFSISEGRQTDSITVNSRPPMLPYIAGFSKYGDRSKFVVAGSGLDKLLVYNVADRTQIGETA